MKDAVAVAQAGGRIEVGEGEDVGGICSTRACQQWHRHAQGRLHPRARLLHRDQQGPGRQGAGALHPPAELTGAERYVTPELKSYEAKVLGAEEKIGEREGRLFTALRDRVGAATAREQRTASALPRLDVWAALAETAVQHRYVRPAVHDGLTLTLRQCRHPVIERLMARESFIPNDVRFDPAERLLLVTGPNMAGKSTILRQIGLCVILAQLGSYVPAEAAEIGVVDRLFTRVGAPNNRGIGSNTQKGILGSQTKDLRQISDHERVIVSEVYLIVRTPSDSAKI